MPIRRSIRKTPHKLPTLKNTPVVVTTPKIISEDSPGLRLTPDNANLPNELTVISTGMEAEETREEATPGETSEEDGGGIGMVLQLKDDEMECVLEQQSPVAKSASKSTVSKSRKTPGKVIFQSPAEFGDQQMTPEYEDNAVATPVSLVQTNSPAVSSPMETDVSDRKGSASKRFSARKCRGRVSTPFYQNRSRRRVSTVDEGVSGQSEGQTSSDSDCSDAKAKENYPRSGLRRSLRRTPSKYRDTNALNAESDHAAKVSGKELSPCVGGKYSSQ